MTGVGEAGKSPVTQSVLASADEPAFNGASPHGGRGAARCHGGHLKKKLKPMMPVTASLIKRFCPTGFPNVLVALALGFAAAGCQSPHGQNAGSSSLASVMIKNKSAEEIQKATTDVFLEDSYRLAGVSGNMMVFEKPGSRANDLAYGGLLAQQPVTIRIKIVMEVLSPTTDLLKLDAFMVTSAGDSFFAEEIPVHKPRKAPYQAYLNKIKRRLGD
jgi:hypothetical protein